MANQFGTLIDAKDIPLRYRSSKYRKMFQLIPIGKAAVFTEGQTEYQTIRTMINHFKKRGEFPNYYAVQHNGTLYVIHPS